MFTLPAARGAGIGRRILARDRGARRGGAAATGWCWRPGDRAAAALALYRSAGFYGCGAYGEYPEDGASVFMEKPLSTAPGA